MRPTQECRVPEGSALRGRAGTLGEWRAAHFTIERAHCADPKTIETDVLFALCRKRPFPVWGGFGHGHVPVERLREIATYTSP